MGHIRETATIEAPIDLVWTLLTDVGRFPEWQTNLIEITDVSGEPGEVGFSYRSVSSALGRRLEGTATTTKSERPRFLEERAKMPGMGDVRMTNVLEEREDRTVAYTFTLDYELGSGFLASLADRLLFERSIHRDVKHTTQNFKDLVESEARLAVG